MESTEDIDDTDKDDQDEDKAFDFSMDEGFIDSSAETLPFYEDFVTLNVQAFEEKCASF